MVLVSESKRTPHPHEKKRHGAHHRQSKHYTKTYWPYMTMLAVVLCGFIFNSLWAPARQVLGYTSDLNQAALLQRSNIARLDNSRPILTSNSLLDRAAQSKAEDMAKRNYWSHTNPDGNEPQAFVKAAGYSYTIIGENLAYGFDGSSAVINAWLNSPEHRANLLNDVYQEVGYGVATAKHFQGKDDETIVVAMYGTPSPAANTASDATSTEITPMAPLREVSRLETISTTHATLIAVVSAIIAATAAMFVTLKHGRMLKKALIHGEIFVIKHHLLDLTLLGIGGLGFILTRSAGVIH